MRLPSAIHRGGLSWLPEALVLASVVGIQVPITSQEKEGGADRPDLMATLAEPETVKPPGPTYPFTVRPRFFTSHPFPPSALANLYSPWAKTTETPRRHLNSPQSWVIPPAYMLKGKPGSSPPKVTKATLGVHVPFEASTPQPRHIQLASADTLQVSSQEESFPRQGDIGFSWSCRTRVGGGGNSPCQRKRRKRM